jgi:hypothetical protein
MNNLLYSVLKTDEDYVSALNLNKMTSNPYMEDVKTGAVIVEI